MQQHHAGGGLVDVLSAVPAGADKGFLDVGLAHAQRGHALSELGFLFQADGESAHVSTTVAAVHDRRQAFRRELRELSRIQSALPYLFKRKSPRLNCNESNSFIV